MKISELMTQLELISRAHGDIDVHLVDSFSPWRLPAVGAARYTTNLVPGMIGLGGEGSLLRFGEVRVSGEFAKRWADHVREAGFYDAVVLMEDFDHGRF